MSLVVTRGLGGSTVITQGYGLEEGPPTPPEPSFDPSNPRRDLLRPGIRWANAPRGRPEFVSRNGTRVEQINTVMNIVQALSDHENELSGVIRYRFRSLPASISVGDGRGRDRFGNPVYPFTGS